MGPPEQPWHSTQYAALFEVYAQNASLEIAWSRVVLDGRTIAGHVLMPFFTQELEGFDINDVRDWRHAEELVRSGDATLPFVPEPPVPVELPGD
jgi:N-acylneuraminate cytidylyltransferase